MSPPDYRADTWEVVPTAGTPQGSVVCLGCGALVFLDDGAITTHRQHHRVLNHFVDLAEDLAADRQNELTTEAEDVAAD